MRPMHAKNDLTTLHWRLEEAALNAWPAPQRVLYDGWLLSFAGGYTKRANSVSALYESRLPLAEKIAHVEETYRQRGLPPIFRLTPNAQPTELDAALAERGYVHPDGGQTWVMAHRLVDVAATPAKLTEHTLADWLALSAAVRGEDAPDERHRALLAMIPTRPVYCTLQDAGQTVACGLGIVEGDYFGLFNIYTAEIARRQGYGRALVQALLSRAWAFGAAYAYLQVMEGNTPARRLYHQLGFVDVYPYWYRAAPPVSPG